MKKLFSISLIAALVVGWGASFAQCTVNNSNTTPGFTPDPAPAITKGVFYSQTVQVYVPTSYSPATIDSVHISTIGGLPTGISYVFNPVDGGGGTVNGGANGAICFSGTTNDTVGTYTLVFNGTAYVKIAGNPTTFQLNAAPLNTVFSYSFTVVAPQVTGCDTLSNVDLNQVTDTAEFFSWSSPNVGYVSGNGALSNNGTFIVQTQVGERFVAAPAFHVTTAAVFAAFTTVNATDSGLPVKIYVYDTTGIPALGLAGGPGHAIDSSTVSLGQFAASASTGDPVTVNFPNQPALVGTGGFYIVVGLPLVSGDTIALVTNTGDNHHGNGWINTQAGWLGLDSLLSDVKNMGNFILAVACPSQSLPPLAAFTSNVTSGCAPTTVNFTDASTQSPLTYHWFFGDGASSTSASPSHTYTTAGTYAVSEFVINGNGHTEAVTTVTVNANPTATSSVSPGGASVVASGGTSYTYLWSNGGTTASISGVAVGTYSVVITDNNGCKDSVNNIDVTQGVGILELAAGQEVRIFPNPATDVLNLVWTKQSNAEVTILDLNGKVVSTLTTAGDMKTVYDVHGLASGSYIVRITDKTNNQQQSVLFSKF